jgi:type II secretory pathway component GspD/PulD (secretin)
MKRIRRLTILTLALLVTASFFTQYAVTASAPLVGEYIASTDARETGLSRAKGSRTSYVRPVDRSPRSATGASVWPIPEADHAVADGETSTAEAAALEITSEAKALNATETMFRFDDADFWTIGTPQPALRLVQGNFCDPKYVGDLLTYSQTVESTLDDLLANIHRRFGVNFIAGPSVGSLRVNVKSENVPWTTILRSQFFVLGINYVCVDEKTVQLIKNDDLSELEKAETDASQLETRYIKLKYLQPSSGGNKNIAGQSTGGSSQGGSGQSICQNPSQAGGQQSNIPQRCKFERLMIEIRQILGLNDPQDSLVQESDEGASGPGTTKTSYRPSGAPKRPYVGQVPGRNMLLVKANASQLREINELIRHADRPPFQVVIKALVYTANENKLKDIGVQASAIFGSANRNQLGGVTSQPPVPPITNTPPPGQLNPGGVRTLGPGFLNPLGLADAVFGLSAIVGTAQFSVQATALQQQGVISLKSRPFATVLDGDTTDLTVGRQIPVIIQAANNIGGSPGTLQILQAANLLSVTPHVIDDENGNPTAVNLELQLESNDVDPSVVSQDVPAVSVRSIQSNFILNQEQTAILGGFTVDSDSKTVTKTPGLGDIPIFGELFKRRVRTTQINRLYFAISVTVIPYGGPIEPVTVPGATTNPPSLTPEHLDRSNKAEPKQVVPPKPNN